MTDDILRIKNSIGLSDTSVLASSNLGIKALNTNGVEPNPENMSNGSYKLVKNLNFIYKEPLSESSKKFLDFTFSEEGRDILLKNGTAPISRK